MSPGQSAISQRGRGCHSVRGVIDQEDDYFSPRLLKLYTYGTNSIRGWDFIQPKCGETSTLAHGETLTARWLYEPQPISDQPVRVEFPHIAGRYYSLRPRVVGDVDGRTGF